MHVFDVFVISLMIFVLVVLVPKAFEDMEVSASGYEDVLMVVEKYPGIEVPEVVLSSDYRRIMGEYRELERDRVKRKLKGMR